MHRMMPLFGFGELAELLDAQHRPLETMGAKIVVLLFCFVVYSNVIYSSTKNKEPQRGHVNFVTYCTHDAMANILLYTMQPRLDATWKAQPLRIANSEAQPEKNRSSFQLHD